MKSESVRSRNADAKTMSVDYFKIVDGEEKEGDMAVTWVTVKHEESDNVGDGPGLCLRLFEAF